MEVNGVAGDIIAIVDVIARNVIHLDDLRAKYKLADLKTLLLISRLSTLKAALIRISSWIEKSQSGILQQQQFVEDLSISVEGCQIWILVLVERIDRLERTEAAHLSLVGKAHVLLGEKETNDYLASLNHQIGALQLLLTILQCENRFEYEELSYKNETRNAIQQVKDDTSSMLLLNYPKSLYSRQSILSEDSPRLGLNSNRSFAFDDDVFNSNPYPAVATSNMKYVMRKDQNNDTDEKSFPNPPLEGPVFLETISSEHNEKGEARHVEDMYIKKTTEIVQHRHLGTMLRKLVLPDNSRYNRWFSKRVAFQAPSNQKYQPLPDVGKQHTESNIIEQHAESNVVKQPTESNVKVLMLGTTSSGKTSLIEAMKVSSGYSYTATELMFVREAVFRNLVWSMQGVLDSIEKAALSVDLQEDNEYAQTIYKQPEFMEVDCLQPELIRAIQVLWSRPNILTSYPQSKNPIHIQSYDCIEYYLNSLNRISQSNYMPTFQDILRSSPKTIGKYSTVLHSGNVRYELCDVGGDRSERRKWAHDDMDAIIFLVDITAYDKKFNEYKFETSMRESLILFETMCGFHSLERVPILLFFNKIDLLERKLNGPMVDNSFPDNGDSAQLSQKILHKTSINHFFPDYRGDPTDIEAVKTFFQQKFLALAKEKEVHVFYTNCVDGSAGKLAFDALNCYVGIKSPRSGTAI